MDSFQSKQVRLEQLLPLIQEQLSAGKSVSFSPNGTSMLPMLHQGRDTVVLSPVPDRLQKYDLPLYRRDSGQFVLHRVIAVGDTYTCMGDNQFDPEPNLRHNQMIAVVTAFTHHGKQYAVTDGRYRLYCRFWHHSRPLRRFWRRGIGFLKRRLCP